MQNLRFAAVKGNFTTVLQILRQHRIKPSENRISGHGLLAEICWIATVDEVMDYRLMRVVLLLVQAGWKPAGQNLTHSLAKQPGLSQVQWRLSAVAPLVPSELQRLTIRYGGVQNFPVNRQQKQVQEDQLSTSPMVLVAPQPPCESFGRPAAATTSCPVRFHQTMLGLPRMPMHRHISHARAGPMMCPGLKQGSHLTPVQGHALAELWPAAMAGEAGTVQRLLQQGGVPANAAHPDSGTRLVLDLAEIQAATEEQDQSLAAVLRCLSHEGWTMAAQKEETGENALYLLATQPQHLHVAHRMRLVMTVFLAETPSAGMLEGRDPSGELPEDKTPVRDTELRQVAQDQGATAEAATLAEASGHAEGCRRIVAAIAERLGGATVGDDLTLRTLGDGPTDIASGCDTLVVAQPSP